MNRSLIDSGSKTTHFRSERAALRHLKVRGFRKEYRGALNGVTDLYGKRWKHTVYIKGSERELLRTEV